MNILTLLVTLWKRILAGRGHASPIQPAREMVGVVAATPVRSSPSIVDLTDELPWHPTKVWKTRDVSAIRRVILHQELGRQDTWGVNRYHVGPNHVSKSGMPHIAYHFTIEYDGDIYRCNPLSDYVWHTHGANATGVGIMLQGDFDGVDENGAGYVGDDGGPRPEQLSALDWLVNHLIETELSWLTWQDVFGHKDFGKALCPGRDIYSWLQERKSV